MVGSGLQAVSVDQSHTGQGVPEHHHDDTLTIVTMSHSPLHRAALPRDDERLVAGGQAADGVTGLLQAPLGADAALLDAGT